MSAQNNQRHITEINSYNENNKNNNKNRKHTMIFDEFDSSSQGSSQVNNDIIDDNEIYTSQNPEPEYAEPEYVDSHNVEYDDDIDFAPMGEGVGISGIDSSGANLLEGESRGGNRSDFAARELGTNNLEGLLNNGEIDDNIMSSDAKDTDVNGNNDYVDNDNDKNDKYNNNNDFNDSIDKTDSFKSNYSENSPLQSPSTSFRTYEHGSDTMSLNSKISKGTLV